jgi:RES domain-containing protein
MLVYRISKCKYIEDLSGIGAATYPGRWNGKGVYVLYTAQNPSLALLESVVHISKIARMNYCMVSLAIPDDSILEIKRSDLPLGWESNPPSERLKDFGNKFVREGRYLAMKVPSAILFEEYNILLNPNHRDFEKVKTVSKRSLAIDERLL